MMWTAMGGESFIVQEVRQDYPPPQWMHYEPKFGAMLREQRRAAVQGEAKLLDRAYWCLTALEHRFGGRKAAAQTLNVGPEVLHELGLLTVAEDPRHSRKVGGGGPSTLSTHHQEWIEP
jgi:hypothetical protein